jgi:hypothetical protein
MPLVIVAVSVVMQPSMVPRYAIVAALAWAPLVALGVQSLPAAARIAVFGVYVWIMGGSVRTTIREKREFADGVNTNSAALVEARRMHLPIVFHALMPMYPVAAPQRDDHNARFLDLPDTTLAALYPGDRLAWLRRRFVVERGQARLHHRVYDFPTLGAQASLDSLPAFLLFAKDLSLPGGYKQAELFGHAVFPRHKVTRLSATLSLFERATPTR